MRTTEIYGAGVKVGTVLVFLGAAHTVTRIESYANPYGRRGRIAYSGEWAMTIFNDDLVEVVESEPEAVPA